MWALDRAVAVDEAIIAIGASASTRESSLEVGVPGFLRFSFPVTCPRDCQILGTCLFVDAHVVALRALRLRGRLASLSS